MDKAYSAARQLAPLRWAISDISRISSELFKDNLVDESAQLLDTSVEIGKVYIKLIELASKPPASPRRENSPGALDHDNLPF